jgi:putative acetyltransferase
MIGIATYEPRWGKDFARLNYEWIESYFTIERHDREILDDPQRWVIDAGGEIFMAVENGDGIGTVAMIPAGEGVLELTKMAVSPDHRGKGIGDMLMEAAISYARSTNTRTVFLETHHKLGPAIALYHKHGFIDVPRDPDSLYERADVRMEFTVDA